MAKTIDELEREVMGLKQAGPAHPDVRPGMTASHEQAPNRYPLQNIGQAQSPPGSTEPPPGLGMYEYLPAAGAVGGAMLPGDVPNFPDPIDVYQGMAGYQAGVAGREMRRAQMGGTPMSPGQQLTETATEGVMDAGLQRTGKALGLSKTPGMAAGPMTIAGRKAPMFATDTLPSGSMARGLRNALQVTPFGAQSLYTLQRSMFEMVSDATEMLTPSGKKLVEFGGGKAKKEALGSKLYDYLSPKARRAKGSKAYRKAGETAAESPDHRMKIPSLKTLMTDMVQKENAWWMREHPELSGYDMPDDVINSMGLLARAIDADGTILSKDFVKLQGGIAGPLNKWTSSIGRPDLYTEITNAVWGLVDEGYKGEFDAVSRKIAKDIYAGREAFKQSGQLERMLKEMPFLERSLGDKVAEPWKIVNDLYAEGRYGDIDTIRNYLTEQGPKGSSLWNELEDNFLEDLVNRSMSKRGGAEWVFNPMSFAENYEVNRKLVHRLFPDIANTWDEFYRVVKSHGDNIVAGQKDAPGAGGAISLATLSMASSMAGGVSEQYGGAVTKMGATIILPFLSAYPLVRALRKPGWERWLMSGFGKHGSRLTAALTAPGVSEMVMPEMLSSHDAEVEDMDMMP